MSGCYLKLWLLSESRAAMCMVFIKWAGELVDVMSDNALIALIEDNYVARDAIVAPGGLRGLMQ